MDFRALSVILTISVVTVFLRLAPFVVLRQLSQSRYLRFLSSSMPPGVMILLVAYTLKDKDLLRYPYGLPDFLALLLSVAIYWRTRNSLLAIGIALAFYIFVLNYPA